MQSNFGKKVLLIKLSSLGDVVFNIPLANTLKKAGYQVSWLVSEKGFSVLENNPCVDEVILAPFERWKKSSIFCCIKEFLELRKSLKEKNFDIIIDTQGRWKSLIFTIFSKVKRKLIGTDSKELAYLGCNEFVKVPPRGDWSLNVVRKYLLYAKYLGVENSDIIMSLPSTNDKTLNKIQNLLNEHDYGKPLIVIAPVTTWQTKHWYKDNWKKLVEKLDNEYNIIFTGTNNDIDYIEYINCGKHLNLAGKTNLSELIELFRKCDLVLSLDSGSTHLAMASNAKRIISIYCSTPKSYYAPIGENYIGLSGDLPCQPCHKRVCKLKGNYNCACTKIPSVETVFDSVQKLMNTK